MARFIVHIGDGKCGSTAIQKALYAARGDLRAQGIIYETTTPLGAHFNLITLAGHKTRGNTAGQLEQARKTIEAIRAATGPDDVVLLSGESLFVLSPPVMIDLLGEISGRIDRLDIVAYVRPPSGMYLSLVQQVLKGHSQYTKPDAYLRRIDQYLGRWKESSEKTSLSVRLFDRSRLQGGDVVEDFAEVLRGLTGKADLQLQQTRENVSLSSEQLVVLQALRGNFLKKVDGLAHPQSNRLVSFFEAMNRGGLVGHQLRLSVDAQMVVGRRNAPVVAAMNTLFPDLGMSEEVYDVAAVADPHWTRTDDVSAILRTTDSGIVELLTALVPLFNPQLTRGANERSDQALAALRNLYPESGQRIASATIDYWHSEKCDAAAAQLEATSGRAA